MPAPKPPRTRPVGRQQPHLSFFVAAALALHLLLGTLCLLRAPKRAATAQPEVNASAHEPLPTWTLAPKAQRAAIEAARWQQRQAAHVPAKKAPIEGTVVDLPPSVSPRLPPKDSAFLAEHNAAVDKQTRSRHSSAAHRQARNEPMAGADRPQAAPQAQAAAQGRPLNHAPKKDASGEAGGGAAHAPVQSKEVQAQPVHRLHLPERPDGAQLRNREARAQTQEAPLRLRMGPQGPHVMPGPSRGETPGPGSGAGDKAAGRPALSMAQLVPDVATLSRIGGGPKNDVMLDVPEGEGTFLNAREFKYASFFNRIKEQISNHWRPLPEYERRDPSGHIYGLQNRMTVLTIALDDQGGLEGLEVAQSSGIEFLDDEGLRAIRAAAPFVHPPKGLLNDDRRIVFKFAFAIDVSGSGYRGLP